MGTKPLPQGWYRDPYGTHEDRYISCGMPTKLVRDGGRESYDAPADPTLLRDLIPADQDGDAGDGSDLRRADDTSAAPYDRAKARRAALDVFDRTFQ